VTISKNNERSETADDQTNISFSKNLMRPGRFRINEKRISDINPSSNINDYID